MIDAENFTYFVQSVLHISLPIRLLNVNENNQRVIATIVFVCWYLHKTENYYIVTFFGTLKVFIYVYPFTFIRKRLSFLPERFLRLKVIVCEFWYQSHNKASATALLSFAFASAAIPRANFLPSKNQWPVTVAIVSGNRFSMWGRDRRRQRRVLCRPLEQ